MSEVVVEPEKVHEPRIFSSMQRLADPLVTLGVAAVRVRAVARVAGVAERVANDFVFWARGHRQAVNVAE